MPKNQKPKKVQKSTPKKKVIAKPKKEVKKSTGFVAPLIPRFSGIKTFFRRPHIHYTSAEYKKSKFDAAIVGVPFDIGVSFRTGQREGPTAVRNISHLCQYNYHPEQDKDIAEFKVVDVGDIPISPVIIEDAMQLCKKDIQTIAKNARKVFVVGGDHTISYPVLKGLSEFHGEKLALVHFDSHYDTLEEYFNCKCTHGTPFKRAVEDKAIDPFRSVHLGQHGTLYSKEVMTADKKLGFEGIRSEKLVKMDPKKVVDWIQKKVKDSKVYVSIDIDVLDPSAAPGTGTPECGGMLPRELFAILREMRRLNIVGGDVMEVLPSYDTSELTCWAAVNTLQELIVSSLCEDKKTKK